MPTKIIDLDVALADDKVVRLRGDTYRLPPELPVETWLRISQYGEENLSQEEQVGRLYECVLDLFRYGDPNIKTLPVGMGQLVGIIGWVYGEGEEEQSPTRPTRTNGGSRRRSRQTRSRSSTS